MEKLSSELLAMVIGHLDNSTPAAECSFDVFAPPPPWLRSLRLSRSHFCEKSLACYATVSRKWQAIVEERTMSSLRVGSRELGTLAAIFEDPRRRALVKRLSFTIELATYGNTRHDHAAKCAAFEQATMNLFRLLERWEQQQQEQQDEESIGPLELVLYAMEPRAMWDGPSCTREPGYYNLGKSAATRRYLTLSADGPQSLPTLHSVAALTIFSNNACGLHPSAACALAAAAPRLRSLQLEIIDPVERRVGLRRQHRAALAAGLLSALRGSRRPVRLVLHRKYRTSARCGCHDYDAEDLKQDGADDLCDGLRLLGEQGRLSELMLQKVLISERLFRGAQEEKTWPALRRFRLRTGLVATSGRWWYTGDRNAQEPMLDRALLKDLDHDWPDGDETGSSTDGDLDDPAVANRDSPYYTWRTKPDPAAFDRLMEAAAEAVLRMPALEFGCLEVGPQHREPIEIQWVVAGLDFVQPLDRPRTSPPEKLSARRCAVWVERPARWDVPESVTRLWKEWVGDHGTVEVKVIT